MRVITHIKCLNMVVIFYPPPPPLYIKTLQSFVDSQLNNYDADKSKFSFNLQHF